MGPEIALLDGPGRVIGRTVMGARGMAIAGGTSEVTRNQIAERILGMPRDPLISWGPARPVARADAESPQNLGFWAILRLLAPLTQPIQYTLLK